MNSAVEELGLPNAFVNSPKKMLNIGMAAPACKGINARLSAFYGLCHLPHTFQGLTPCPRLQVTLLFGGSVVVVKQEELGWPNMRHMRFI